MLSNSKWSSIDSPGDVDANTIYQELLKDVRLGSQVPKPNVVILEAGKEPNADKNIYQAYYSGRHKYPEFSLTNKKFYFHYFCMLKFRTYVAKYYVQNFNNLSFFPPAQLPPKHDFSYYSLV